MSKLLASPIFSSIIASRGLPAPEVLGASAALLELVGGLLLVVSWRPRIVAATLAAFVVVASLLFHAPFALSGPRGLEFGSDALVLLGLWIVAMRSDSNAS